MWHCLLASSAEAGSTVSSDQTVRRSTSPTSRALAAKEERTHNARRLRQQIPGRFGIFGSSRIPIRDGSGARRGCFSPCETKAAGPLRTTRAVSFRRRLWVSPGMALRPTTVQVGQVMAAPVRYGRLQAGAGERKRDAQQSLPRKQTLKRLFPRLDARPQPLQDRTDLSTHAGFAFSHKVARPVHQLQILGQRKPASMSPLLSSPDNSFCASSPEFVGEFCLGQVSKLVT